jgi:hypothetical protein
VIEMTEYVVMRYVNGKYISNIRKVSHLLWPAGL